MQDNSNLIKVIDVIDFHLMLNMRENDFEPRFKISEADVEITGLSYHQFGQYLGIMQSHGYITVTGRHNPFERPCSIGQIPDEQNEYGSPTLFYVEFEKDYSEYRKKLKDGKGFNLPIEKLDFNTEESILHLNLFAIPISKTKRRTNSHFLLAEIFKDKSDIYEYSELVNTVSLSVESIWKACRDINHRIYLETNISDFLNYSMEKKGSVCIDKKYLLK